MIVVVGAPSIRPDPESGRGEPAGLAARIALAIAATGTAVQLAGKVGEDPAGDEVLLALARGGVHHDAVLRDPDRATPLAAGVGAGPADAASALALLVAAAAVPEPWTPPAPVLAPGLALDAADLALCLSYLRELSVIVAAEPLDAAGLEAVGAAAAFAGAALVVIVSPGRSDVAAPPGATVLEAPEDDADDEFARLVARFAVALGRGDVAGDAFTSAVSGGGWEIARDG
ncbi:MAG: PfkB family carbohydrate kinase [Chloroflexi bacterium]|jgi:sugar/nucleoside kinase (ribokinase family)|nr:PfkB family carbohydrate kinase [Chloroflexota bacterium]